VESYFVQAREGYVGDLLRAGAMDEERARLKADRDYASLEFEGDTVYLAAYDDQGAWVGVLGYGLRGFDAPHEEPTVMVYDLEVFEDFRRRGHARAMLAHAAAVGSDAGALAVRLVVWAGNDGAHALYLKAGFRPEQVRMRLPLTES
jgi:ribosomal protein S18 acetylase RimI-like enzyme